MPPKSEGRLDRYASRLGEFREWVTLATAQTGKGLLEQLRDIRELRQTGGQCGISDYYWYRLYDDSYLRGRGRKDFLGWRLQQSFSFALNPRFAALPADDKQTFMLLADSAGLPVAPVLATYHPARRISEAMGIHLKSSEAVATFLRDPAIFPVFGKPSFSQQGYGAAYLAGYDPASDRLQMLDGSTLGVDQFVERIQKTVDQRFHKPECGFLFQQSLKLAPEIYAITQWPALCGVRVICLNGPDGVKPIRAIWKVANPPNHVDNFSLGKNGNFLADVDLETGKVRRMIRGFWPKTEIYERHPTTGQAVEGFQLPGWGKVLEACELGGAVFPLLKIHHWDFALTDQGPLILELNDIGATELAQVHGYGLLTEDVREFLKRFGNVREHAWIRQL